LLAAGVFMAWQAALIWTAQHGVASADLARVQAIAAIGTRIRVTEQRVQEALLDPGVQQALREGEAGRPAAAQAMQLALPEIVAVTFFSPDLDEVLAGDLKAIGYAKAAALMKAKVHPERPLVETRMSDDKKRRLMFALPARVDGRIAAFAVVELPIEPVLQTFLAIDLSG